MEIEDFSRPFSVAVSLIIPMYNCERFIEETLTSVVNQTFKNYELIAIDDCSTDRTVEIVESFNEKFSGRLRLIRLKKNSGHPSMPRNLGIKLARGKYVAFLDNDDVLVSTAFEVLHALAEKYDADVLRTDRYRILKKDVDIKDMPMMRSPYLVKAPTPEPDDILQRLRRFTSGNFKGHPPWKLFLRRDFLIENEIEFPVMHMLDDNFFALCCHVCAARFILIPTVTHLYRFRRDSVSHSKYSIDKSFYDYINDLLTALQKINRFMDNHEIFSSNPELRMRCFDYIFERRREKYSVVSRLPAIEFEQRYDTFGELFSRLLADKDQVGIAKMMAYFFCNSEMLKAENQRLGWQIEINKFSTPVGAAVTYFRTFLTVDEQAENMLHSNDPQHAIKVIRAEKKFALYIPSMEKYIASFGAKGELSTSDAEVFLGDVIDNADGTVSLRLADGKNYISPRNTGQCIMMNVNKAWEHLQLN